MKFTIGKTYTARGGFVVTYKGLDQSEYASYSCKECGKERKNLHWFYTDNSNYPIGTECVKKFIKE